MGGGEGEGGVGGVEEALTVRAPGWAGLGARGGVRGVAVEKVGGGGLGAAAAAAAAATGSMAEDSDVEEMMSTGSDGECTGLCLPGTEQTGRWTKDEHDLFLKVGSPRPLLHCFDELPPCLQNVRKVWLY